MLFGRAGQGDIGEIFPMALLPAWWQFPLPGLPTTFDVATRVGHGVSQEFHAPFTHEDWLMYHDRSCPSSTVSRGRSSFIDLNPYMGELGRSPGRLDGVLFCCNVFLPLPPTHRYFAVCSGLPSTGAHLTGLSWARFECLAAAEWILDFGVAYLHKIGVSGTAMVLSDEAIAVMERCAGAFPPLPVEPTFTGAWPRCAVVWDEILRSATIPRSASMDSRFLRRYSVMNADEWAVTLDPADDSAVEFCDSYKHLAYGAVLVFRLRPSVVERMRLEGVLTAWNRVARMIGRTFWTCRYLGVSSWRSVVLKGVPSWSRPTGADPPCHCATSIARLSPSIRIGEARLAVRTLQLMQDRDTSRPALLSRRKVVRATPMVTRVTILVLTMARLRRKRILMLVVARRSFWCSSSVRM